jgi:hypothetical protein
VRLCRKRNVQNRGPAHLREATHVSRHPRGPSDVGDFQLSRHLERKRRFGLREGVCKVHGGNTEECRSHHSADRWSDRDHRWQSESEGEGG